jgi:hypothetical protein
LNARRTIPLLFFNNSFFFSSNSSPSPSDSLSCLGWGVSALICSTI